MIYAKKKKKTQSRVGSKIKNSEALLNHKLDTFEIPDILLYDLGIVAVLPVTVCRENAVYHSQELQISKRHAL